MLESIRHFLLIVEHGTFTVAAARAHLSQPALTASMQRLEAEVGATLLVRGRRGATLTAAGAAFLPHARTSVGAFGEGRRAAEEIIGLHAGEVRIGAGATVCTYLLPAYVARFRRRYPKIRFVLRELGPEAVKGALEGGELDLGLIADPSGELWRRDELVLVRKKGVGGRVDPRREPFVTFPPGSTTRAMLDAHFPDADIVMELSGVEAVKANVRAGIGVALISRAAVEAELRSGRLVRVRAPGLPLVRSIHLVHRGEERMSPAVSTFRTLLFAPGAERDAGGARGQVR